MIRCCVAEPLVRTRLGAFPPIITAPSHLSRFTNFGHRVCVQSVCWEQEALLQSVNKPPTHMQERERQGKKREGKKRKENKRRKERKGFHIFFIILFSLYVSTPKRKRLFIICKCPGKGLLPVLYHRCFS